MQIILTQDEILSALTTYAKSQINLNDDQDISIELKAGRGENGHTATLDVIPKAETPKAKPKAAAKSKAAAKPDPKPEPEPPVEEPEEEVAEVEEETNADEGAGETPEPEAAAAPARPKGPSIFAKAN